MSNKTLNASHAKTASARNKSLFFGGILLLLLVLGLNPLSRSTIACTYYHTPTNGTASIGTKTVRTETVVAEATREKGLSGRPCIKDNQAMLFVFDKTDNYNHCFWMKDMRFAIDIVWLDKNKQVVYMAKNVEPATYPASFCPGVPTGYTLELKSGQADKLGMVLGDRLSI